MPTKITPSKIKFILCFETFSCILWSWVFKPFYPQVKVSVFDIVSTQRPKWDVGGRNSYLSFKTKMSKNGRKFYKLLANCTHFKVHSCIFGVRNCVVFGNMVLYYTSIHQNLYYFHLIILYLVAFALFKLNTFLSKYLYNCYIFSYILFNFSSLIVTPQQGVSFSENKILELNLPKIYNFWKWYFLAPLRAQLQTKPTNYFPFRLFDHLSFFEPQNIFLSYLLNSSK